MNLYLSRNFVGQTLEGHSKNSVGTSVMLEDRNMKCDHVVIFTWSIPLGGHELFFLAMSGLRKEFGVILTVEANFYASETYGILVFYSVSRILVRNFNLLV